MIWYGYQILHFVNSISDTGSTKWKDIIKSRVKCRDDVLIGICNGNVIPIQAKGLPTKPYYLYQQSLQN